ncbi:MAG: winged helix-turn-helix transcriptional regulator [Oscillospiraceae bacterium]|nr:winged helix-turn-helix transcriptional regulator [Oscillospiraceae bacterium]
MNTDCGHIQEHEETVERAKSNMASNFKIERMCRSFKAISEPSRLRIILALMEGEMCVYHIVEACGGTQSNISHQLRVLKDNNIIKSRRDGQNVLYSISDEHVSRIIDISREHLDC